MPRLILSQEKWKAAIRFRTVLPGYYVSNFGRVKSIKIKGRKIKKTWNYPGSSMSFNKMKDAYILKSNDPIHNRGYSKYNFTIPGDLFKDYDYAEANTGCSTCKLSVNAHRLVMETFKPIDKYPPIPKKDWKRTPASAKQFIRDTAFVDHIDSNRTNNHISNLRWVTPKENEFNRKAAA